METVKDCIRKFFKNYSSIILVTGGGIWITTKVVHAAIDYRNSIKRKQMLETWESSPKDVVIMHAISRGKTAPNTSPFVIKLETYLRMTNIPYQIDHTCPYGPNAKTPWITLNGQHMADSQLIIEHLGRKFSKTIGHYSTEERAIARAVRIMMDEHFYWGLGLWRYVYSEGIGLNEINALPPRQLQVFYKMANKRVKTNAWIQGTGRHDKETVLEIMKENLRALSAIIGTRKFLLGDEPCEEDCAVFGFLSQVLWCAPSSPYNALLTEELTNLQTYCILMKETFWPDWEKCLAGAAGDLIEQK